MNCEVFHERIVTSVYGELADEQTHELERHLPHCAECQKEREQVLALKTLAEASPVVEPDANLVARSRQRLEEALDALPPLRWYERLNQRLNVSFASLLAAPAAAVLLLVAGIGFGSLAGFEIAQNRVARQEAARPPVVPVPVTLPQDGEISSVSSIVRHPNSEIVDVTYNQVVPQRIEGSLDNPAIRQLLVLASQNMASTGVHDDSVGLLADECRAGHSCQPSGIRDALLVALRYDRNANVRLKALGGLAPYIGEDVRVRDSVLESLLNDSDARVRTAAIGLLNPVEADTSVRQVLHSVANTDRNPYVRTASRQVLSQVPRFE